MTSISRREFVTAASATLLLGSPNLCRGEGGITPIVETSLGKVRGVSRGGVHSFKGLPYGASTEGAGRFRPPRPAQPWGGVRDASSYGPPCYQPKGTDTGIWDDPLPQSEDCLRLNVWTPATQGTKRPVMVWLHGGANQFGSGGVPGYDGTPLARDNDVVVVTINHRLNVFGLLYLGELAPERYPTGNHTLMDIVAALQWIRENIAAFGGDPGNVTVFGESAGAGNISTLLAMPAAKGLFHKAIIQSGPNLWAPPRENARVFTAGILKELAVGPGELDRLESMPAQQLLKAFLIISARLGPAAPMRATIDGITLRRDFMEPDFPEQSAQIPLLFSTTQDEAAYVLMISNLRNFPNDAALIDYLIDAVRHSYGLVRLSAAQIAEAIRVLRDRRPAIDRWEIANRIFTEASMRAHLIAAAERQLERGGAPLYVAEFQWKVPSFGRLTAFHGVDCPLVFNRPEITIAPDASDTPEAWKTVDPQNRRAKLAQQVSEAWATFARSGSPQTQALGAWPQYDLKRRATMALNYDSVVTDDLRREQRELFVPPRREA